MERQLNAYEKEVTPLPGISSGSAKHAFLEQLIESERRGRYVKLLLTRNLAQVSANPDTDYFDPLRAAIIKSREGARDEAFWMVFLYVHFGKHRRGGWRYAREVYGRLQQGGLWDWQAVSVNIDEFRSWLDANLTRIKRPEDPGGFGNHRKYESLSGWSKNGTGAVVASYVQWIKSAGSHDSLISAAASAGDETAAFDTLFRSMTAVHRFGRTAKFDYLTMVGKLELAPIAPGRTYMSGATGPRTGARLLFGAPKGVSAAWLEQRLRNLEDYLSVGFDALEDALCNWQKSPTVFKPFRG
ncbi:alpha-glutamyl/putrescinyl thymine pyrophosphorylase clade 3 protein [Micromonospora sp. NPDC004704]